MMTTQLSQSAKKDERLELAQEFVVEWSDLQSPDETERLLLIYYLFHDCGNAPATVRRLSCPIIISQVPQSL